MKVGFTADGRMSLTFYPSDSGPIGVSKGDYIVLTHLGDGKTFRIQRWGGVPAKGKTYRLSNSKGALYCQISLDKGEYTKVPHFRSIPSFPVESHFVDGDLLFELPIDRLREQTPYPKITRNRLSVPKGETSNTLQDAVAFINKSIETGVATARIDKEGKLKLRVYVEI